MSISGTHLVQSSLQFSSAVITISNALKLIFSSMHSSLVIICLFMQVSWSRRSAFSDVTSVHGTWFVLYVTVATAKTHHPLPHYGHIHCLISINAHQVSVNVSGCHFFCMEELSYAPFLKSTSMSDSPLLPFVFWQQNVTEHWWEGSASSAMPPTSASDVMGQHSKIGGITFRAAFVYVY